MLTDSNILYSIVTAVFVGLVSGYLGSVMVLRRMALVGDALSHVALPGIALALLFSLSPFLGAFSFLLIASLIIWGLEDKTTIPAEALVGIMFTVSLAIGILVTPEPELLEALFGDISNVGFYDMFFAIGVSSLIFIIGSRVYRQLILGTVSEDLALTSGVNIKRNNLIFLILVSGVVALGVKVVGTLLMGALVIIPAAASKNMSQGLKSYSLTASILGLASGVSGLLLANFYGLSPGPMVVLVSAGFFAISFLFKK